LTNELLGKRLELLRELVPTAARVEVLRSPSNTASTEIARKDLEPAARAMGLQIQILDASNSQEINAAFASFVRERPDALFVGLDPFLTSRRVQLATLATRHVVPMTSGTREIVEGIYPLVAQSVSAALSELRLLLEVNRPLLLQCGNAGK
jgi:putative tryptophan/tyrosine transport system substrate-binding protein